MKKILAGFVITILLVIFGFTLVKLVERNKGLKSRIPHLSEGDDIVYFDLHNIDNERIDASVLKSRKPSLIFLFPRPCAPCSNNIAFWSKMALITQKNANIFGIIAGRAKDARDFWAKKKTPFNIYFPGDLELFLKKMKIRSNMSQTILCQNGRVEMIRLSDLDGEMYTEFLKKTFEMAPINKNVEN